MNADKANLLTGENTHNAREIRPYISPFSDSGSRTVPIAASKMGLNDRFDREPERSDIAAAQIPVWSSARTGFGSGTWGISAPSGIVPSRPAWKSSIARWISARVFITNGP